MFIVVEKGAVTKVILDGKHTNQVCPIVLDRDPIVNGGASGRTLRVDGVDYAMEYPDILECDNTLLQVRDDR